MARQQESWEKEALINALVNMDTVAGMSVPVADAIEALIKRMIEEKMDVPTNTGRMESAHK